MASPFMNYGSGGSTNISVNSIKPNARGNITIGISRLSGVEISDLQENQTIKYDGEKWINGTSGSSLQTLSDVEITDPIDYNLSLIHI